jgi:hypothetical protein
MNERSEAHAMGKVRFQISMSLDGYVAGPNISEDDALGEGDTELHEWMVPLRAFKELQGEDGDGEVNASTPIVEGRSRTWARRSWDAACSARSRARGGEDPWKGETIRRITTRSSCSPTTSASPSR